MRSRQGRGYKAQRPCAALHRPAPSPPVVSIAAAALQQVAELPQAVHQIARQQRTCSGMACMAACWALPPAPTVCQSVEALSLAASITFASSGVEAAPMDHMFRLHEPREQRLSFKVACGRDSHNLPANRLVAVALGERRRCGSVQCCHTPLGQQE